MNGNYETRKRGVDKIVLLGLFIVVLLMARFIVVWRSAIVLSEPIVLDCAGLSVSTPVGNGWRSEKQWKYEQNAFTLSSFFDSGSGGVTALVSCRYLLAATKVTPDVLFEEKASAVDGSKIARTGQIEIGGRNLSFEKGSQNGVIFTIDWAHIKRPEGPFDMFFGVAQLPNNRRLDIEVYQTTEQSDLAERVFKSITESLRFTDNHLLEAGSKIVAEIKNKGLDSFLAGQDRESFFLIKDAKKLTIGFTMDVLGSRLAERPQNEDAIIDLVPDAQSGSRLTESLNILAGSFFYIRGRYDRRQVTLFQSRNSLDEFIWKSETIEITGRSGAEIALGKDGIMTVKKFAPRPEEKDYQISPAAIPEVLGELIFSQMLDSDQKEIFVDIIESDGKITPTLVSRIETPHHLAPAASSSEQNGGNSGAAIAGGEAAYVFGMEFLDGRGFSEQVYIDNQRRISKRLLQQESTYTLERTSAENILGEFPEQGSYILQGPVRDALRQKDKILEQNQPQENSE